MLVNHNNISLDYMKMTKMMAMCVGMAFPLGMFAQTESVSRYEVTDHMQQTIDGFGASDAWSMWQIGEWDDSLQVKVADWLFSKDKGIGLSVWRFNAVTRAQNILRSRQDSAVSCGWPRREECPRSWRSTTRLQ